MERDREIEREREGVVRERIESEGEELRERRGNERERERG
jgi:hypothetical protein